MPTIDQAVEAYIRLRDMKDDLRKKQREEMAPIEEKMETIENWLLATLIRQGAESTKTPHGTCYKSTRTSAKVGDWDAALTYIKEHELWHMLERRVSKAAVEEFVEVQGEAPPGIDIVQEVRVNVRR